MKYCLSILLLFFTFLMLLGQNELTPEWVRTKASSNGGQGEAWGVDVDEVGNIYWPVNLDSMGQGIDIVCYKLDPDGNDLWSNPLLFGGPGTQQAYIANYHDGSLYIGGRQCPQFIQTCDMLLIKADPVDATIDWDATQGFAADGYEEVDGLIVEEDAIYTGGWAQEFASDVYFTDLGLWKLDADGNTEWAVAHGDSATAEHQDGHFVVDDDFIYAAGLWGGTGLFNLYNGASFLGKFSKETGALVDSVTYGYPSAAPLDIENCLGMTTDGEFLYLVGYSTPESANNWQILIAKFDKNLNLIWQEAWGGEQSESARAIAVTGGVIYIGGLSESMSITGSHLRKGLLLSYDTDGNYLDHHTWGEFGFNEFRDIALNADGSAIYLSGTTTAPNSSQPVEAFILKVNNSPNAISETELPLGFTIYPNPTSDVITIEWQEPIGENVAIDCYSDLGQLMWRKIVGAGLSSWQIAGLSPGSYWLRISNNGRSSVRKVVVD